MEHENEFKEEARDKKGSMLDSFTISSGSAAKGISIGLKVYYNAMDIDEAQKKIENTLKIRQYLMEKGIIQ